MSTQITVSQAPMFRSTTGGGKAMDPADRVKLEKLKRALREHAPNYYIVTRPAGNETDLILYFKGPTSSQRLYKSSKVDAFTKRVKRSAGITQEIIDKQVVSVSEVPMQQHTPAGAAPIGGHPTGLDDIKPVDTSGFWWNKDD